MVVVVDAIVIDFIDYFMLDVYYCHYLYLHCRQFSVDALLFVFHTSR